MSKTLNLQHPSLISIEKLELTEEVKQEILQSASPESLKFAEENAEHLNVYRLVYQSTAPNSQPVKVEGFLIEPKEISGKIPVIIYNRGGTEDFGSITPGKL
ncbi:MAG: hypothetical protein ACRCZE_00840, partial [Candidatus Altimarinota bacterium]